MCDRDFNKGRRSTTSKEGLHIRAKMLASTLKMWLIGNVKSSAFFFYREFLYSGRIPKLMRNGIDTEWQRVIKGKKIKQTKESRQLRPAKRK